MRNILLVLLLSSCLLADPGGVKKKDKTEKSAEEFTSNALTLLWREPTDIVYRDLYFGPGGEAHQPHGPYTFIKEDMDGSNPKFSVRDRDGMKWKAKLATEAKPETVATRLVWAVGYFANEDYFLSDFRVDDMPRLRRHGANRFIGPGGVMHDVRLKREPDDEKKIGTWSWRDDPFSSSRELNGLRVMMALINNWDLKDTNNSVYEEKENGQKELIYMVSDLGASFGTAWFDLPHTKSKGNLDWYRRTPFITRVRENSVSFEDPRRPALFDVANPHDYFMRLGIRWIGHDIPREDVKWMGSLLARLSDGQIRDAFRAAGYSPAEIERFSSVVENRIAELNRL
jgi:hypothetical protein